MFQVLADSMMIATGMTHYQLEALKEANQENQEMKKSKRLGFLRSRKTRR